ncbi:MAG: 3-deoxy-8-phosphooctulonate synthase [Armatimonadota bacterium]
MMTKEIQAGSATIGGKQPLTLIAGPCALESLDLCIEIGETAKKICDDLGMQYIFKASFDKANRSSLNSSRGPGIDKGLEQLAYMRKHLQVPVLTDVHEVCQVADTASVVDIIQIPAFLCRQTDLLLAAAETGKVVNVKKGQFLAPSDMGNLVKKVESAGNANILLTERGVSFGYGNLIVDMRGLAIMRELGYPVVFDATHSVQRPGGLGTSTGGDREFVPHLIRAACAVGIDALFIETHPDPELGLSDAATMLPLGNLRSVLIQAKEIDSLVRIRQFEQL